MVIKEILLYILKYRFCTLFQCTILNIYTDQKCFNLPRTCDKFIVNLVNSWSNVNIGWTLNSYQFLERFYCYRNLNLDKESLFLEKTDIIKVHWCQNVYNSRDVTITDIRVPWRSINHYTITLVPWRYINRYTITLMPWRDSYRCTITLVTVRYINRYLSTLVPRRYINRYLHWCCDVTLTTIRVLHGFTGVNKSNNHFTITIFTSTKYESLYFLQIFIWLLVIEV